MTSTHDAIPPLGGPPTGLPDGPAEWIERRAKLFEAGAYPDKDVTLTPDDLRLLAEGFESPVPVLIEHAESPLELGFLTSVEAAGGELFGVVTLSAEADRLVRKSGAKSLSLGLSADLRKIREVSLVRNPRVASAQLFGGGPRFEVELPDGETDWRQRYEGLQERQARKEADQALRGFVREGRLCPAQVPFAQAILACADHVDFDGESRPLRQLLIAMIERQPPAGLFSEIAPGAPASPEHSLSPQEADFYQRHFPDLALEEIAKRR